MREITLSELGLMLIKTVEESFNPLKPRIIMKTKVKMPKKYEKEEKRHEKVEEKEEAKHEKRHDKEEKRLLKKVKKGRK